MLKMRIAVEELIAKKTLEALIAAGFYVTVNDGEEDVVLNSQDVEICLAAMFSTDDDILYVDQKPTKAGELHDHYVRFIYGNSGWDVINDYSTALEKVMEPVMALAELIDEGKFSIDVTPGVNAWNKN